VTDQSNAIDIAEVREKLDHLESLLLQCRSVFPTLGQELIGQRAFMTASYYLSRGYEAQIQLKGPISTEFIERNKQMDQRKHLDTPIRHSELSWAIPDNRSESSRVARDGPFMTNEKRFHKDALELSPKRPREYSAPQESDPTLWSHGAKFPGR